MHFIMPALMQSRLDEGEKGQDIFYDQLCVSTWLVDF